MAPFFAKRGMSLPLEALIGLILAVLAMVAIVYTGARLGALFIPSTIDPATETNFKNLAKTITALVEGQKEKDAVRYFPFHIGTEYLLVGFSRGQDGEDDCYSYNPLKRFSLRLTFRGREHITRPPSCGQDTCLCLYKNKLGYDDVEKESPLKCLPLPNVDFIYSPYYLDEESRQPHSKIPDEIIGNLVGAPLPIQPRAYGDWTGQYQYFIVYGGGCFDGVFGVQQLYLDMHRDENKKTHLFIAGESRNTQERWNDLQMGLPGFPQILDKQLNDLLQIIKTSKDPFAKRDALFTVLSSPSLIDRFITSTSQEEFRRLFFARYSKSPVPIPSLTEARIRDNAERVWEQYAGPLMRINIPYLGKDHYVRTCIVAFTSGREENECWVPKHIDLNT